MAWDDAPPTKEELKWDELPPSKEKKSKAWDEDPPSADELNQEMSATEGLTRGFIETLPVVGSAAGGLLGAPLAPPFGALGGAGLGAAAGESAKTYLKDILFNEKKPVVENLKDIGMAGLEGSTGEAGGQVLAKSAAYIPSVSKGIEKLTSKLGKGVEFTPVQNKEAILEAASKLGINDIPSSMLTSNPGYQALESGLAQSGTFPAQEVKQTYNKFFEGLKKTSGELDALKTGQSDFSLGKSIKENLQNQVQSLRQPVSELYKDIEPHLKNISVDKDVVKKAFSVLKRDPMFQTIQGKEMISEFKNATLKQPDLLSLKELRTSIGNSLGPMASPLDESRARALQKTITSVRNNSVEALKAGLPKGQHGVVDELINQIALADATHSSNINEVNAIKNILGNKEFDSPSTFLNKLSDVEESKLAERAGSLDVNTLTNLKEKFPDIFINAKNAKINDMVQRSTNPVSGFNENTFIKQYDSLDTELKNLFFDPGTQEKINSLKTLKQAMPAKLGPSGTPEGLMTMDMFNPQRNVSDYLIKKSLDMSKNGGESKILNLFKNIPSLNDIMIKNPAAAQTIMNRLSPLEKTDTVPMAPQMPKTPQEIKADKSLTNTQKARAMNESSRIRSLMPPGQ